jgi:outer membrane protein assembly factor BamB
MQRASRMRLVFILLLASASSSRAEENAAGRWEGSVQIPAPRPLNLVVGRQIWKTTTRGLVPCTPAIDHGTVYIGSYHGKFYALDPDRGQKIQRSTSVLRQLARSTACLGRSPIRHRRDLFLTTRREQHRLFRQHRRLSLRTGVGTVRNAI